MPAPPSSAESASGVAATVPHAQATAAEDDLDRLKDLLIGNELGAIESLEARVEGLDRRQRDLPARLPEAIVRAQDGAGATRIAAALAAPVTQALGTAVRENRQMIVDVLFPVIGPAIRKAIAEALRTLVADVNGAIESSLTPRGIGWRVQAWRSGVPYAEIVLKHTLKYRIDHVFLIERESGLVLARESAPHLPALDADAIAGMLTAIGAFVRDSVGRDGDGTLDSARVGEHLLWVVEGPRANLACFIHGVPPASLHAVLEQRLEAIHAAFAAGDDAGWRPALHPEALMSAARADAPPPRTLSRAPLLIALAAVLVLLAFWLVRFERDGARLAELRARLAAQPGFFLTAIDTRKRPWIVHGLIDPDADPVEPLLRSSAGDVFAKAATSGYVSTDDAIVARRARRLLAAPASIEIAAHDGTLAIAGRASAAWIDAARDRAGWIAGVRRVEITAEHEDDAKAQALAALSALARELAERRVAFVREIEPSPDAATALDAIVADLGRAQTLGRTAGVGVEAVAVGTNDDPGSDAINARLRAGRAGWLADALAGRGIANVRAASGDDAEALAIDARSAFVRLVVAEGAR